MPFFVLEIDIDNPSFSKEYLTSGSSCTDIISIDYFECHFC